jgi:DNA-binding response OmpR family regulator
MSRANALAYQKNRYIDNELVQDNAPSARRILLIEDNKNDVALIKRMLKDSFQESGLEFADVPRMVDALELIDNRSFDLAILDLSLLDIEGSAAVAAFHAQAPNIPIIVHTGSQCPKLRHETIMCGAKHYLVKGRESPFSFKFMIQQTLTHAEA